MSKQKPLAPLNEAELAALRADPELVIAYLEAALNSLETPEDMETGLQILNIVAEAYRDLDEEGAAASSTQPPVPRTLH